MSINKFQDNTDTAQQPANFLQRHQRSLWITLIALAVAVAGVLTYVLFFRSEEVKPTYEGDAVISVVMPESTSSGSEVSIRIAVENRSNARLTGLALEVFYPQDFEFLDSTPDPPPLNKGEGRQFTLNDLEKGGRHEVTIVGRLGGSIAEIKTVSAKLKYIPENFRSTFVAEGQASTEITSAALLLQLLAPTRVVTGQSVVYRLRVENVSAQAYRGLLARLDFPPTFQSGQADEPAPFALAPGESKTIEVSGKLPAEAGTQALVEAAVTSGENVLGRSFAFTAVDPSPLAISHSCTCFITALPADLEYKVQYRNQSDTALTNATIAVAFESEVAPYLEISGEGGKLSGAAWIFTPVIARELLTVAPGSSGEFTFRVKVPEDPLIANRIKNPELRTRVEYTAKEVPQPLSGNSLSYKMQTELTAAAEHTAGAVELSVNNTVNDVEDAVLTAFVNGEAGEFSDAAVEFDSSSGLLKWRLGEVFAFTGSFHETRKLTFKVTTAEDTLLRDIVVTGKDTFADREIESNKITSL